MSKSENRQTSKILSFRLTPDEYSRLAAVCAASGLSISAFVRRVAFKAAALPVPVYEGRQPDKAAAYNTQILGAVGKIGNNLNQLTKLANSTKSLPAQRELRIIFAEIRALRIDILGGAK